MSAEETSVKLGADTQEINQKVPEAADKVESAFERMLRTITKTTTESAAATKGMKSEISGHFDQVGATIKKVTSIFGIMTAALAGGAAFAHIIGETNAWTGEVAKLAKGLGESTQEASGLAVALHHIGSNGDAFLDTAKKLDKQVQANEAGLNKMGLATRDANGNMLGQRELLMNGLTLLNGYEAGTSRNMAAQKLFGRGAGEVNTLLKLNAELLEHSKKRAEELHLVVGPEGVKQMKAYKEGMADVKEICHSVEIQMGQALMPVLIQLGAWFSAIGPTAIDLFKGALNGVITFVMYLGLGVITAFETIKAGIQQLITHAIAAATALGKLLKGDLAGASAAWSEGNQKAGEIGEAAFNKITAAANKTNDAVAKIWGLKKSNLGPAPEAHTGKQFKPEDGTVKEKKADESRAPQWKADLEEMKLANTNFLGDTKKADLEYWQQKSKDSKLTVEESKAVNHEILALKREIQKDELQDSIEGVKLKMAAERQGSAEKVALWEQAVKKIGAAYGLDSKEYKAALIEKTKLAEEHAKMLVHLADSVTDKNRELMRIRLDSERDNVAHIRELGAIDAEQEIAALRKLEQSKAEIEAQALREKLAREKVGTLEYQKILNEIEVAEAKHGQVMQQYDRKLAAEQTSTFRQVYGGLQSSFASAITGMITQGTKFGAAMRQIASQVLGQFIQMGVKMLFDWVQKQIMMTIVHKAQDAARTTTTATGEATRSGMAVAGATTQLSANAVTAASGAASSQASIPIVGPILAGVAMAAMLAMVLGLSGSMKSAAGGWGQIPSDQVAQVHKDEMILPAELAEGVRSTIGSNKGNQGGNQAAPIYISAVDARGVKRLLSDNGGAVAGVLQKQARNFKPIKRG